METNYSQKYFDQKANRRVLVIWTVICLVLTAAYALEVVKGLRTVEYLIQFLGFALVPLVLGAASLNIFKGSTKVFREIAALGYAIFYFFVLQTTTTQLGFVYALPLASVLVLYKSWPLMLRSGAYSLLALAINIVTKWNMGMNTAADLTTYEVQVAALVMCYVSFFGLKFALDL